MASVIDLTSSPPPHASGSGEKKRARHVNDDVSNTLRMKVYGKPKAQKERDVNPASDAKTMYIDPSQRDKFAFAAQAKNCLPHGRWPQVLENTRAVKINSRFVFVTPRSGKGIEMSSVTTNTLEQFVLGALIGHVFATKGQIVEASSTKEFGPTAFTEVTVSFL